VIHKKNTFVQGYHPITINEQNIFEWQTVSIQEAACYHFHLLNAAFSQDVRAYIKSKREKGTYKHMDLKDTGAYTQFKLTGKV